MAIGDSHGNSRFVHAAIERAARLRDRVDRDVFIVSVGDFGFWRPPDFATSLDVSPRVRSLMAENQLRLAEIVAAWQPQLLVHGHFHHSYRATAGPDGTVIQVIGIDDENIDTSIETIDLTAFANRVPPRNGHASADPTDTSLPT